MRKVNNFILNRFSQDEIVTFSLIDLSLENSELHFTDGPHSLTVVGEAQEYQSDIGILTYSAPVQTSIVDRESFNFTLEDITGALRANINRSLSGKNVKFRIGFFNDDGTPNLLPENIMVAYKGYVDAVTYDNDGEIASVTVECSSPMQDLSLVKTLITSKQGMDQVSLTDTSFDKVIDQNEIIYKWGKV